MFCFANQTLKVLQRTVDKLANLISRINLKPKNVLSFFYFNSVFKNKKGLDHLVAKI